MLRLVGAGGIEEFQWSADEQVWPFEKHSDGSPLYCKQVDFGTLPNNGVKSLPISINLPSLDGKNVWEYVNNYEFLYGRNNDFRKSHSLSVFGTFIADGNISVQTTYDYTTFTGHFRIIYKKD